jgi:hypothetical protein
MPDTLRLRCEVAGAMAGIGLFNFDSPVRVPPRAILRHLKTLASIGCARRLRAPAWSALPLGVTFQARNRLASKHTGRA